MADDSQPGRNHQSTWTIKDITFVEKNYGQLPVEDIARILGRGIAAVRRIALLSGAGKKPSPPWTDEERELIHQHYSKGLAYMQSLLPGRTKTAINSQASKLGVTNSNWSAEERQYLRDHYGTLPTHKIAATLGRSISSVRSVVRDMGIGKKAKTPGRPWTEQEMAIMRANYHSGAWIVEVSRLLPGRTLAAIGAQASKTGLTKAQYWQPEEIRILKAFYPVSGSKVVDKLPGRTVPAIKEQAAKLGLRYRDRMPRQTPVLPWREDELDLLRRHLNAPTGELQILFPGRTKYAIEKVRARLNKENHTGR